VLDNETYVAFGGNRTSGPIEVATAVNAHGGTGRSDFESETFLVTHSLRADGFDASEDGTGRGTPLTVIQDARGHDKAQNGLGIEQSEVMYTLDGASQHAIAFTERTRKEGRNFEASEELSYALTNPGAGGRAHSRSLYDGMGVRRLTPVECERLQGFPDGWTQLDGRTADGPRYKALGNAVTVPVIQYLGERIREVMRW